MARITVTIPDDVAEQATSLSEMIGCSRSAAISAVLESVFAERQLLELRDLVDGDVSEPSGPRRLRGDSGDYIRDCISEWLSVHG